MIQKFKKFLFSLFLLFVPFSIAVAQIDYIIIRDQPGGVGNEITDVTITTDETLTLYAAGYNNPAVYSGDVSVDWSTTGTIDRITHTGSSWTFDPDTVGSGTIVADHATATDDATGTITVNPGALDSLALAGLPASVIAGSTFPGNVTVTAFDGDGNQKTDYTGTVTWFSSDPYPATLPTDDGTGWTSGQKTFNGSSFRLYRMSSQTITVQDGAISRTSGSITVTPAALGSFTLGGVPASIQAGQPFSSPANDIIVTAYDIYSNQKTNYTGTVTWSSSDPSATLPTDNGSGWSGGQKTFNGNSFKLYTTSTRTITVQAGAVSRVSGSITVTPAALGSFTLNNVPTNVTAGQSFGSNNITVTAFDIYNNQKTNYSGTVTWSSSDPSATLPTDGVSGWNNGQKTFSGSGFILYRTPSQTISVQHNSVIRTSGLISVSHASISSFNLSCSTSLTAGSPFRLDVTGAQDPYGNNWSGTIDVSVINGGGDSPSGSSPIINDIQVNNGTGNAYQTLFLAESNVEIRGQAGGVSHTVTSITVSPNVLSSLKIRNSSGNGGVELGAYSMVTGDHLSLFSAGYDAWGNYRTDEYTNWSSSGLTPAVNTVNSSSITFTPTLPGNGTVTATYPSSSISDHTGIITVNPGTVTSFAIDFIGTSHRLGYPFTITITALDDEDNTATGFVGRVLIDDLTGTVHPDTSGYFVNGTWTGGVTVYQEYTNDAITVTALSGSPPPTGTSDYFDVIQSPGIQISQFYPVREDSVTLLSSVTAGQAVDWFLKMVVQNLGSDIVALDSIKLNFIVGSVKRNDYSIVFPTVFLGSATRYLPGEATDSVMIQVDTTGTDAGAATVQGFIYLGTQDGGTLIEDTLTTLSVQTPAQVLIYSIFPSQAEVTRAQDSLWSIVMAIRNNGESTVVVDSSADSTYISFDLGSNWQIRRPLAMNGGDWILVGGETDSIVFTVEHTGEGELGACVIHGQLIGVESNTGRRLVEDTQDGGWGTVTIEEPPFLQITEVTNLALNAPFVNTGQTFSIRIRINNNGGDGVHDTQLNLYSDGASSFTQEIPPFALAGYESKVFEVSGIASYVADPSEIFTADVVTAIADNTGFSHSDESSPDDTTRAVIQNPAVLRVRGIYPSKSTVIGGQVDPWVIKVAVRNAGQAFILLDKPQSSDLSFLNNNVLQLDYKVDPDTVLKGGGRILETGSTDTLIYTVRSTGRLGGSVTIRADIHGKDRNNASALVHTGQTSITVQSEQDFRVMSTRIKTLNTTEAGNGYVNTGQSFKVMTIVENGLGQTISNIQVRLQTNGSSVISSPIKTIPQLVPNSWDSLEFNITAGEIENLSGETFTAGIYQSSTQPGPAVDSTAVVFIQNPALLQLQLSLSNPSGQFSVDQSFTLQASLINQGTALVDPSGRVRIRLPNRFTLLSSADTSIIAPDVPAQWPIQTPESVDFEQTDPIAVVLYRYPHEINTGNPASVVQDSLQINVTVIQRSLEASLSIPSPLGASDGELSTDQTFTVRVSVQSHHCKNITAEIALPSPWYKTEDDLLKSVISNEVVWQVTAPSIAMGYTYITVVTRGEDALQDGVYIEDTDHLLVSCISKADLYLTLSILSPPDAAEDNIISLGQEFEIGAFLENRGDADTVGMAAVTLQDLPTGYTTTHSHTKALVNGQASWIIRAPDQATGKAVNIEVELTTIPSDVNTGKPCYVSRGSDKVAVTTEGAWLAVSMVPLSPWVNSSVVPGQKEIKLMVLELDNRGVEGASPIRIHRIAFDVEDRSGLEIPPSRVLSKISIFNAEDSTKYGECVLVPDTNRVNVHLNLSNVRVTWDQNLEISIYGEIPEKDGESYFQLNIPSGDYIDARDNTSGIAVPVKDITGEDLVNLRSDPKHVFNPESEPILWNCPNPFGEQGKTTTDISFYVKEAKKTTLRIFTIIGEPVCTKSYTAAELENVVGSIQKWVWDGRNDKGSIVLNGVYYLFMETDGRVIAKTKIAFVK